MRIFIWFWTIVCWSVTTTVMARENSVPPFERTLSLSGADWRICADPDRSGTNRRLFDADASALNWVPATVPGNIQADLEAAHLLMPLWYGNGDPRLQDVARTDWWYRKDFLVPPSLAGKRVALVFDGVDYECEVWLNSKRVGANAGMFRRFSFDVADALRPGQSNRLAVRIARMPPTLAPFFEKSAENGIYNGVFFDGLNKMHTRLKDLKSPTNLGWDWGINIWTLGIWKDVRLVASGPARIDDTRVQCSLDDSFGKASITATLEVDSLDAQAVRARFRVFGNGQEVTAATDVSLSKGRNVVKAAIQLDKPALWWPNGQGEQPLYTLRAEIDPAGGGATIDACSTRFGIRDVRWVPTENAPADFVSRYQLVMNGRPVRTMGSNLIPPDLLFGRATPRGLQLLRRAKAAGMNTLRHWGGGVVLSPEFYDLADELGIMLSFEFPIANILPQTDAAFLGNLEATSRSILKQVRNHPSIIEYSGGNEMPWNSLTQHPALLLLRKVVAEEDGRLLRATCPDLGATHGPWGFLVGETYREYNAMKTMRAGEFGMSSPANLEVWYRDIPPKSQAAVNGYDDPILVHKNVVQGAGCLQDWLYKPRIDDLFGKFDNLPLLVRAGQFLSAEELRYAIDALGRKGKRIGGLTNWDFNEPWTNGAGSYLVDYDGRPLMNYDFVRQALVPVCLSLCYDSILYRLDKGLHAALFLTSDAPRSVAGLRWKWLARDRRGTVFSRGEGGASIEPRETRSLAMLDLRPPAATICGPTFVELRLEDSTGKVLGERLHIFGIADFAAPLAGLLQNRGADSDDDSIEKNIAIEPPSGPGNLAFVGNGARPATASSSRSEPIHHSSGINDGRYGNQNSWIGATPRAWFQIDLGKPAVIGRFKLGRDRNGAFFDRLVDYLKIEASLDGKTWQGVFEKFGLAAITPTNTGSANSTVVQVSPVRAQFVKVTVDSQNPASGTFPCIDEFEVYGPGREPPRELPQVQFVDARPEISCPVRRTLLAVTAAPPEREGDQEVLKLLVKNSGAMTALFCEPHPLIEYRTDLFIDNNCCFIPPGESRTITIKAASSSPRPSAGEAPGVRAAGLTLEQTGWRVSCWNADDLVIEPSGDVLLAVGRKDAMCREFSGYSAPSKLPTDAEVTLTGRRPDPSTLPCVLAGKSAARFKFNVDAGLVGKEARLRLHTADQAADTATSVEILVNGRRFESSLPKGLGIQRSDAAHLAFPISAELALPSGTLIAGENLLELRVANAGWFTWDAMDLRTNNTETTP